MVTLDEKSHYFQDLNNKLTLMIGVSGALIGISMIIAGSNSDLLGILIGGIALLVLSLGLVAQAGYIMHRHKYAAVKGTIFQSKEKIVAHINADYDRKASVSTGLYVYGGMAILIGLVLVILAIAGEL